MRALLLVFVAIAGATSPIAAARVPAPPVPMRCTAAAKAGPAVPEGRLCKAFARALSARIGRRVAVVASGVPLPLRDGVSLTISRPRADALAAELGGRIAGRRVIAGPLTIDVMDRSLLPADVDKLARALATSLRKG